MAWSLSSLFLLQNISGLLIRQCSNESGYWKQFKVPFAHRMGLIPDEQYEVSTLSCITPLCYWKIVPFSDSNIKCARNVKKSIWGIDTLMSYMDQLDLYSSELFQDLVNSCEGKYFGNSNHDCLRNLENFQWVRQILVLFDLSYPVIILLLTTAY